MMFLIRACKVDEHLAVQCLESVRRFYPDELIVCVADGDQLEILKTSCDHLNAIYHQGDRLKVWHSPEHSSLGWLIREFQLAQQFSDGITIVLDADCLMLRRFNGIPDGLIFGQSIIESTEPDSIQGACYGFTNKFAAIAEQELSRSDSPFVHLPYNYNKYKQNPHLYNSPEHRELAKERLLCDDLVVMLMCRTLNIPIIQWNELGLVTPYRHGHLDWQSIFADKAVIHPNING